MTISKYLDPKNDVAFKRIFGTEKHKDILIRFINDILGFTGPSAIKDVTFLSPVQDPDIASKKQSIVDVLCKDENGVQYIIEMQVCYAQGFEKRAQYYAAKAYCRQADRGGLYANLKEVIFIAISNIVLFPNKTEYKSDHIIMDRATHEHDLQDFSFTFIELPKFTKRPGDVLDNIVEKWCYFFKYADRVKEEDLQKIIASDQVMKMAYGALDQFGWSEPELIAYEQETKRIWDNQAILNAAVEKGRAQGMEKGKAEGMTEGLAQGVQQGIQQGKAEIAKSLLAEGFDAKLVSRMTGLSEDEVRKLHVK